MIMSNNFFEDLDKEIKTALSDSTPIEHNIKKVIAENNMRLELDDIFKMYVKDNVVVITTD